jgi:hypothetical protein
MLFNTLTVLGFAALAVAGMQSHLPTEINLTGDSTST